ncbi:ATP-binding cassette domain-containing protein [Patescibacteria group bacterium]|nr:ATP-binding cassette domain-containing protein [Patescibacteria group bacterium]MCL5010151.1 ATP-binding cassette domain-containing protein [Patescibacteria group bacterium]
MIKLDKVSKKFGNGSVGLSEVTLNIEKGEFVFLVGRTGSGKTTFFRLLIRDFLPSEGSITVGNFDLIKLPKHKIAHLRRKIGVVFQDLKLLMDRTIFENILLPLEASGFKDQDIKKKTEDIMEEMELSKHSDKFPLQLSGGELQRVAIARALILAPEILLADEPTGNLDPQTGEGIVNLLMDINKKGTTVVMATHNDVVVNKFAKRVISLDKGKVIKDQEKGKYEIS